MSEAGGDGGSGRSEGDSGGEGAMREDCKGIVASFPVFCMSGGLIYDGVDRLK